MKNPVQASFRTDFFRPPPGKEFEANAGRYGKALALWIAARLEKRGFSVEAVLAGESGWTIVVSRDPFPLWVQCANVDKTATRWKVCAVARPSLLQHLFGRAHTTEAIESLTAHLDDLLPGIPGVADIVWE